MLPFDRIAEVVQSGQPAVLVTVVLSHGSTPRKCGARMLVYPDGSSEGTVGGGALEYRAVEMAKARLGLTEPSLVELDLGQDSNMSCGGRVGLFIEPLGVAPTLLLFGAGHVGQVVAELANRLGFQLTVIDDRPEYATADRFPSARQVITSFAPQALAELPQGPHVYAVVVTYTHVHDTACVRQLLGRTLSYIGMMGSRRKGALLRKRLLEEGIDEADVARIRVPVGLPIGAETPEEIALSIVAELVQVRREALSRRAPAALVAAAGASERMGFPKALLELEGETLVHRLARLMIEAGARPCVVTVPEGPDGDRVRAAVADLEVIAVRNRRPDQGLIGSVRSALDLAGPAASALVLAPVDSPFVDRATLEALLERCEQDAVVVPVAGGQTGHPVVFGRKFFKALQAEQADHGARAVVEQAGAARRELEVADSRLLQDLNTTAEAEALGVKIPD